MRQSLLALVAFGLVFTAACGDIIAPETGLSAGSPRLSIMSLPCVAVDGSVIHRAFSV
jgi:hypothetical protein